MKSFRIDLTLLGARYEFISTVKVTQALIGGVFLGGWLIAMGMMAVFGSPALRGGPTPFLVMTILAVCFAIIPTGLLFSVARLSPLFFPAGHDDLKGGRHAIDACVIDLNRVLLIIGAMLVMAALTDLNRSSGRTARSSDSIVGDFSDRTAASPTSPLRQWQGALESADGWRRPRIPDSLELD